MTSAGQGPAAPPEGAARRAGRPRDPAVDDAILESALRLLCSEGYARMSIDAVAAGAGVGKATIYLRYSGKADLATAALARMRETAAPGRTGDLRADLLGELRQARRNTELASVMSLIGTCLTEEQHTPELLRLFRERVIAPRRAIYRDLLTAAARRGQVPRQDGIEAAVDLLTGAYQARYLSGEPFPDGWEDGVVDAAMSALGAAP